MKSFLQKLLILFALALCGLISFQWVRETDLRRKNRKLEDSVHAQTEQVRRLKASISQDQAQIERLDTLKQELTQRIQAGELELLQLRQHLAKSTNELARTRHELESYVGALQKANDNLRKQNEDIRKQNESVAKLAQERNELVMRLNKMTADYNALVLKWNRQQEQLLKAGTNSSVGGQQRSE